MGLPGLVRAAAYRAPEAVALLAAGRKLTYAQLEVESDALAVRLRAAGEPGDVVAVCLPRGPEMVVALLAALKARMPYLPLAVNDPPRRRDLLLNLSDARHVLVDAQTGPELGARPGMRALHVELGAAAAVDEWTDLEPCDGNQPVYVLFTSGSTGTPKGVVVPSDALVNRLCWMNEIFGIGPADRVLQKTPYTFDVSGWELWSPLIAGATMVLLPPDAHLDPGQVARWVTDFSVTLCHFVPSMLAEFLRWPEAAACTSLRAVFCSGEELSAGHVRQFRRVLPAELHNLYGPTEAAIDVTHWQCPDGEDVSRTLIGGPITNCTLVVLDEDGSPTPPGAVGELAIGGVPLALGYIGASELTRRAFVDAPSWVPVPRLYLTGDMVRQRPDGLEYLGRKDSQVKVRGQRVELTAVEDALRDVASVVDAAAAVVDHGAGHFLCALVVLAPGHADLTAVRSALREVLPDSHVPTSLFPVADFPLSRSGKLDRNGVAALLAKLSAAVDDDGEDDLPARLWRQATGSNPATPGTGFLDAGGHSLAAARLVGLTLVHYGARLPLRELLRANMSLAGLRTWLSGATQAPPDTAIAAPAALSPQQHGLWVWSRLFPNCPAYNVTAVLKLDRHVDISRLERAANTVVHRHRALRTSFRDIGRDVCRHVHSAGEGAVVVCVGNDDAVVTDVLDHRFVPDRLPRLVIGVQRGERDDTVLLAVDHLVADQRTLDLLLAELAQYYAGEPAGRDEETEEPPDLPGKDRRERDLAFWRDRLLDAPSMLELPWQRPRPPVPTFRGASLDLALAADHVARVERFCAHARITPFVAVLTVFARRLCMWAGVDDIVVGVPMSGRETPEEQNAIGFAVRTLPVRLRGLPGQRPEDVVGTVADALLDAAEHASVSFEEIVAHLGGTRDLTTNPVFRVWCNDLGHERPPTRFGEASARLTHPPARWSPFDVNLYLHDAPAPCLRLVYSTDVWQQDVAAAFLRQCRDDLLAAEPRRDHAVPATHVLGRDSTRRTCADLVTAVLAHARGTPDRIAITCAGREITFAALAGRVRKISALTRARGGRRPVGVLVRRHADLASMILGCWHAGAAPLLVDADAPESWRAAAMSVAGTGLVLEVAPKTDAADSTVRLSEDWWTAAVEDPEPPSAWMPNTTGHALLTSGTTGVAAVVALPADALPDVLDGYRDTLGLTSADVFAFTVPPDHDPVFRDLVLPLVLGATVHVPTAADHDSRGMARWLADVGATVLHATPARATLLAAAHQAGTLPALRHVVCHGDTLRYGTVAALRRLAPAAEIHNLYGTTETPQASSLRRVDHDERGDPTEAVPIAASAPHRRLAVHSQYSTDEIGVPGEIVVTGTGLHHTTQPTDEYRTGDLGRLRPDGLIDPLGRVDRQVSHRGHRVQLDGIEAVLLDVPGVRACHVAVEPRTGGLVAWWAGDDGGPDEVAFRAAVRARLPAASMPVRIRQVAEIPLTARGKVDTGALLRASVEPRRSVSAGDSPQALLDLVLSGVAEQQPGLDLGPDDDFFDAGLTSLALLRLYESIGADVGADVTIADLFRFPTARRLAEYATGARSARTLVPPRRRGGGDLAGEMRLRRKVRRAGRPDEGS